MSRQLADTRRPSAFYSEVYGDMTSVREVLRILGRSGEPGSVKAADLYTRSLDCQNHGGYPMLERIAAVAAPYGMPNGGMRVLDVGCGVGGPGRFLADRYGCRVIGVDVLPERVKGAEALSKLTGLARQLSYRQADATALPFRDAAFHQVWMLDASIHVRDKTALLGELARVLRQGGLLVLHDQWGSSLRRCVPRRGGRRTSRRRCVSCCAICITQGFACWLGRTPQPRRSATCRNAGTAVWSGS